MSIKRTHEHIILDAQMNDEYGIDILTHGVPVAITISEALDYADTLRALAESIAAMVVADEKARPRMEHAFDVPAHPQALRIVDRDEAHTGPMVIVSDYANGGDTA